MRSLIPNFPKVVQDRLSELKSIQIEDIFTRIESAAASELGVEPDKADKARITLFESAIGHYVAAKLAEAGFKRIDPEVFELKRSMLLDWSGDSVKVTQDIAGLPPNSAPEKEQRWSTFNLVLTQEARNAGSPFDIKLDGSVGRWHSFITVKKGRRNFNISASCQFPGGQPDWLKEKTDEAISLALFAFAELIGKGGTIASVIRGMRLDGGYGSTIDSLCKAYVLWVPKVDDIYFNIEPTPPLQDPIIAIKVSDTWLYVGCWEPKLDDLKVVTLEDFIV